MKQKMFSLFMLLMLVAATSFAQETGIYNLTEAGTLKDIPNISTVTHLTLTGFIDARDTKFMRDNMPNLTEVDLSDVTVIAYMGTEGSASRGGEWRSHSANEMPAYSFGDGYSGKSILTSVKLPTGITAIGQFSFCDCSGLTNISFPAGITSIGTSAFAGCSSLAGNLDFPAGLISIDNNAFSHCSGLTGNLVLPDGLTSLGGWVFQNCSGLTGNLDLPVGLTSIGSSTFQNCNGLTGVSFSMGITSIGWNAFNGCSGLMGSLVLPTSVVAIGNYAFQGCGGLTDICFSTDLIAIGSNSFGSCGGLRSITNFSLTPPSISRDVFAEVSIGNISLTVPSSVVVPYQSAPVWKDFKSIAGGGVLLSTKANNRTLGGITGTSAGLYPAHTAVSLTATPAEGYNFLGWTNKDTDLEISTTLTFSLAQDAVIVANFGNFGSYNLAEAGTLKNIPNITTISRLTLTGIIDTRDVKFMRDNMPALTEVDLSGVTIAAYTGFEGTRNGYYGPYPANEMPAYSFYIEASLSAKTNLVKVKLPAGLTSIADFAFYECIGLAGSLELPAGITTIGEYAFTGCSALRGRLSLPKGLTSIGNNAFQDCNGLYPIVNRSSAPQAINRYTFANVLIENIDLYVPEASVETYKAANVWKDFRTVTAYQPATSIDVPTPTNAIRIYPDPETGSFRMEGITQPTQITVTDINGRTIIRKIIAENESIAMNRWPQGIYLVNVNGKTMKITKRF
jgi:hypothetical protein